MDPGLVYDGHRRIVHGDHKRLVRDVAHELFGYCLLVFDLDEFLRLFVHRGLFRCAAQIGEGSEWLRAEPPHIRHEVIRVPAGEPERQVEIRAGGRVVDRAEEPPRVGDVQVDLKACVVEILL